MFGPPQKKFLKAAEGGDMAALQNCVDNDIPYDYDINALGEKRKTALHLAAEKGHVEAVKLLVERRANIEALAEEGISPLFCAVRDGRTEAAKILIAAGANVNTHSDQYSYPLHWAAHNGDLDVVKALIGAGADMNVLGKKGERTPLYYAIASNRGTVAEFLLGAGARTDIPGADGVTDAAFAKINNARISKMIEDAAAKPKAPAPETTQSSGDETAGDSETWKRMGPDKAALVGTYPDLNRKITEIFNFATRERLIITENLKTGAETMGAAEKFENLPAEAVRRATEAYNGLGGAAADAPKKSFTL
ncbi:MAG: ankyrin repeat domain-containing protein [Alphaproteobacteria bacterium]